MRTISDILYSEIKIQGEYKMKSEKTNKIYNAETEAWLRDGINTGKISKIDYTDTFGRDLTSNRLFISNGNRVCEFNKRSQTRGKPLLLIGATITKVYREETIEEREVGSLERFKNAFKTMAHPNLWTNYQKGYEQVDIAEFIDFREKNNSPLAWNISDYAKTKGIAIVLENNYKTTTIKSQKPRGKNIGGYQECLLNIKNHLDNKETFSYFWEGNYWTTVSGKVYDDGVYRAFLSLEYKGTGNGHYYILINDNTALFAEDD